MIAELALGAWRAGRGLASKALPEPATEARPEGRLIWLIATREADGLSAKLLAEALLLSADGLHVLVSTPCAGAGVFGALQAAVPAPHSSAVRAALSHWRPDLIVYLGPDLPPALVLGAEAEGITQICAGLALTPVRGLKARLWRRVERLLLRKMRAIFTEDHATAALLAALPLPITVAGQITETPEPLPASESERAAISNLLRARPVWAAIGVPKGEERAVFAAHRSALHHAHRTLLIFLPEEPARGPELREAAEAEGWTVSTRWEEGEPDSETEILFADDPAEAGLWYRLAPITLFGGTFFGKSASPRSPLEAAALGSAILHGPQTAPFAPEYARLEAALAARLVPNSGALGEAVADLLAPDRAAMLAHNAWAMTSGGAGVTLALSRAISDLALTD